jgi:hypothetical protein
MKRCKECGVEQPDEAFTISLIRGDKIYRRHQCNRCKQAYKASRKAAVAQWLRDYKKTLHCQRCDFADFRALTFHHKDRETKKFNVGDMIRCHCTFAAIRREIAKCTVLCFNCHQITHHEERAAGVIFTRPRDEAAECVLTGTKKVCRYCLVKQDEGYFEVCKVLGGKVYRRHRCRDCKRTLQAQRRDNLRAWFAEYKKTLRCSECGFCDFRALEFHHSDGEDKDDALAVMVGNGRSRAAILREITKCLVLCANCHRILHYDEQHEIESAERELVLS